MEQDLMQSIWNASNPQKEVEKLIQSNIILKNNLQSGDKVLVKGSRGMHTDEIVEMIKDKFI